MPDRLLAEGLVKTLPPPPGGGRRAPRGRAGRGRRAARARTARARRRPSTWWSGWCRPEAGRVWLGGAGAHRVAHAPAGARAGSATCRRSRPSSASSRCARTSSRCWSCSTALGRAAREARAQALLEEFGLTTSPSRWASSSRAASGGGRRLPARSSPAPRFMLFDEPFAGVDPINVGDLQRQIARLKERGPRACSSPTTTCRTRCASVDRAYLIAQGQVIEEGTPRSSPSRSARGRVYLGERFRLQTDSAARELTTRVRGRCAATRRRTLVRDRRPMRPSVAREKRAACNDDRAQQYFRGTLNVLKSRRAQNHIGFWNRSPGRRSATALDGHFAAVVAWHGL